MLVLVKRDRERLFAASKIMKALGQISITNLSIWSWSWTFVRFCG